MDATTPSSGRPPSDSVVDQPVDFVIPDEWKDVQKHINQVDLETVNKLLSLPNKGEFINWKNPGQISPIPGATVLHSAIAAQRFDIVRLLLKHGADNLAAVAFFDYLYSPAARALIRERGYVVPER